ncbi:hypothetical protein BamMEX5DRAFT_0273 [Burkholderia ambifaria MEX-5]|uniref:Uncharacterized protein n=1 Tax=Burkholderia ambifaria MEX-5 TaxID=396597 RepID=B1SXK7_9BURK|nr:hypothetical protein BamMEX5DRAFT_0273 [Burkholderia ambifaria MEX-5]
MPIAAYPETRKTGRSWGRSRSIRCRVPTPQMVAMQQMMALQHGALANAFAMPMPQPVGFAMPPWAMPEPVVAIVPAQPSTRALAPDVLPAAP